MNINSRDYNQLIGFALNNSEHSICSLAEILSISKDRLIGETPLSVNDMDNLEKLRALLYK